MTYTPYNWSNATNLARGLVDAPNHNTGGSFWVGILWFLWLLGVALMSSFGWEIALLGSSFAATVIGIFLAYLEVIAWNWVIPFAAIDLFMFFYIMWSKKT